MLNNELENRLGKFIGEFGDDLCSLELLLFFGRHPNARFNRTAVVHALSSRKFDTGVALKKLTDSKLVLTYNDGGLSLYGLTKDEAVRDIVDNLISIDQGQWQNILEKILDAQGIV